MFAATPVPVRVTEVGEDGSLLANEMLPETAPVVVGVNFAVNVLV